MSGLLPIFNDEDFVPHAYLDALFQQLGQNGKGIDLTSSKDLNQIQSTTLALLNQLDSLTKEVTSELQENVQNLENTNSIISYSYQSNNKETNTIKADFDSKLKPTSRLEYYIDSLSIGIDSLNHQVSTVNHQIIQQKENSNTISSSTEDGVNLSKVDNLLTLSKSKENLQQVLKSLNTIKSIIDIAQTLDDSSTESVNGSNKTVRTAPTSSKINGSNYKDDELVKVIKPNEFQLAINVLKETIIDQFNNKLNNESKDVIDYEFLKKINDLIKISEVFRNFNKFYSIYNNFVNFLKIEKKNYLNGKNLDDNDDLFREVLK